MSYDIRYDINKPNDVSKITATLNGVQHIFINSLFYLHVSMKTDITLSCIIVQCMIIAL
jgi:hypothetical protein